MAIFFYDHKSTSWQGALDYHFGTVGDYFQEQPPEDTDALLFAHCSQTELPKVSAWLSGFPERRVVLLGSGPSPFRRSLSGVEEYEGKKWAFCPWRAEEFRKAERPEIQRFIESVKTGRPDFNLFAPAPEILNALAILVQGYLAVHARHDPAGIPDLFLEVKGVSLPGIKESETRESAYWGIFGDIPLEETISLVENEWKAVRKEEQQKELPPPIRNLVNAELNTDTAVAAYEALKKALGGPRGN